MIPIACPLIGEDERNAALAVLSSGQLAQGPRVLEFETRFAAWCGVNHAVATSSGTSALHVALLAHGIGLGDEVITSPFSFIASANCALYVGARPVFADIEPEYYTLDPAQVAARITPRTRAVVPVHLYGQPCNMPAIQEIAARHGLAIIEDACQAHGARLGGRPVGSWGTACYSFYPTKNMTTLEGGMITTNEPHIAEQARLFRDHGSPERYRHVLLGYNFRMTEVQAAIGLVQLRKVDGWNERRRANAQRLSARLPDATDVVVPAVRSGAEHVFHQYTIRLAERDAAIKRITERGVAVGVYYPVPIHRQPLYRDLGYDDCLPNADRAAAEVLSLPVHPTLSSDDLDRIVASVRKTQSGGGDRQQWIA